MVDITFFEKETNNLPEGWISLVETTPEKVLDANIAIIKHLIEKNHKGIILSASRPAPNLIQLYRNNHIDINKIFFLDCVTDRNNIKQEDYDNVAFIENSSALTSISIYINKILNMMDGNKFLFVDSLTTMLIHNDPMTFAQFIHGMLTNLRINSTNGILLSLENGTNKDIRTEIAQLCDKIIKI